MQLGQLELVATKMGIEPRNVPMPPMFHYKGYQESLLGCNKVWYLLQPKVTIAQWIYAKTKRTSNYHVWNVKKSRNNDWRCYLSRLTILAVLILCQRYQSLNNLPSFLSTTTLYTNMSLIFTLTPYRNSKKGGLRCHSPVKLNGPTQAFFQKTVNISRTV